MMEIEESDKIGPAQWTVIAVAVAFAAGSFLYRYLMPHHRWQSSAMFIGLPTVLAVLLALTPKAKTVTGGIMKGITLFLLIVAPLLGEGWLCILMASPLFYLVGAIVGKVADWDGKKRGTRLSCLLLVLLPLSLEGVVPQLTMKRSQTVRVTETVNASVDAVERSLAESPRVTEHVPDWISKGFPQPLAAWGSGLEVGDRRTIHFAGAEGDPPGDVVMRVAEHQRGYVRFETVSDSSKLTQWVRWTCGEVNWKAIDAQHTSVTWTIHFNRQLDPAWYFVPWERAAVHEAARYLILANATPVGSQ
jgi:hypothetical protein